MLISVGADELGNVVGYVWNTLTTGPGRPALTLHGHGGGNVAVAGAAWSPDGSMIAMTTGSPGYEDVIVFHARTGKQIRTSSPDSGPVRVLQSRLLEGGRAAFSGERPFGT